MPGSVMRLFYFLSEVKAEAQEKTPPFKRYTCQRADRFEGVSVF